MVKKKTGSCVSGTVNPMGTAVVVCPLRFERRALGRAGVGRYCELVCCGAGAVAAARWASDFVASGPVILCGLAGALNDNFDVGTAHAVAAVVDVDGRRLEPSMWEQAGPVISCPPSTLRTPQAKQAWSADSGADLADLESEALARVAIEKEWRWGIVRGVSDGPDTTLPAGIDTWVDTAGRTRTGRVLGAMLTGRVGLRRLMRLRSDSTRAMAAAAIVVERMLQ